MIVFLDVRDIEGHQSGFNIENHGGKTVVVVRGTLTHGTMFEQEEFLRFIEDAASKLRAVGKSGG